MGARGAATALAAGVLVTGCGAGATAGTTAGPTAPTTSSAASVAAWDEPGDYRFTVESSCGERAFIGRYRVDVRDGRVAAAEELHPDEQTWLPVEQQWMPSVPTLGDLLDDARLAAEHEADVVEVRTDPADGHPVEVRVDEDVAAIDDEVCYVVTGYRPGG
jgi:hypothetical protein